MVKQVIQMLGRVTYAKPGKPAQDGTIKVYATLTDVDDTSGQPEQISLILPDGQKVWDVGSVGKFEITCVPKTSNFDGKRRTNYQIIDYRVAWGTVTFAEIKASAGGK
jgi:hypothetical protein